MSQPYAKIIADSISEHGVRLTTMEVRFHRFVLAEFNTHRVFSRNSASSRAIPVRRQMEKIMSDLAYPLKWPRAQAGMQGGEEIADVHDVRDQWHEAAMDAVYRADRLLGHDLHKSLVNRPLEPFMWHTAVVTATAWENFFEQRNSPLAQPEIQAVAAMMYQAYTESNPLNCGEGDWQLPYADDEATTDAVEFDLGISPSSTDWWATHAKISAARCARVSYKPFDADTADVRADLALYEKLTSADPPHWSPLEHPATPWGANHQTDTLAFTDVEGNDHFLPTEHLPRVGNLLNWRSLRIEVEAQKKATTYR